MARTAATLEAETFMSTTMRDEDAVRCYRREGTEH